MSMRDAWMLLACVIAVGLGAPFVTLGLKLVTGAEDRRAVEAFRKNGLRYGGLIIGALERGLVVTFVLRGDFQAIGLILAAKGLIRYAEIKDARDQKVAEYVLIGTMLSLLWAVAVGLIVLRLAPPAG
jgi:hypothetical protein